MTLTRTPARLAASIATLALLALLAVAGSAEAAPPPPTCTNNPKVVGATCATVLLAAALAVGEASCLLNTAPINWVANCTGPFVITLPLLTYALCYYNTPPSAWTTCV
jgi:hypothetical protein